MEAIAISMNIAYDQLGMEQYWNNYEFIVMADDNGTEQNGLFILMKQKGSLNDPRP